MSSKTSIGDICSRVCSGGTPKSGKPEYYEDGTIPWLNTSEINFNKIRSTASFITDEGLLNSSAKWINSDSVIVAMYGATAGRVAISKIPLTTNQACCNLEIDGSLADYRYVYYWFKSHFKEIAGSANGAAQQNLSAKIIKSFEINLPDLAVQHQVADQLSLIDDKIELNNQLNDYLAELLLAKFSHWIETEDDSWGHSQSATIGELDLTVTDYVANGSFASLKQNVELLNDDGYAYFMRNTDLKSGIFNVFVPEHSYKFLSKSALFGGEVIISNVGDVGSVHRCPELDKPMTLGNNEIMIKGSIEGVPANDFLYLLFNTRYGQHLIDSVTGGSVQRKFNKTDFRGAEIPLPTREGLLAFNSWVAPMFSAIDNIRTENHYLEKLRDTLLPRLMSGEIDVSKEVL